MGSEEAPGCRRMLQKVTISPPNRGDKMYPTPADCSSSKGGRCQQQGFSTGVARADDSCRSRSPGAARIAPDRCSLPLLAGSWGTFGRSKWSLFVQIAQLRQPIRREGSALRPILGGLVQGLLYSKEGPGTVEGGGAIVVVGSPDAENNRGCADEPCGLAAVRLRRVL